MIKKVNLKEKFNKITDYWNPAVVGELNDHQVRLAKFKGEFCFHKHDEEDEMFLVIEGEIQIELRDQILDVKKGEFVIIPRGVEHKPIALEEAHVLMFEKSTTVNTGDVINEMTNRQMKSV